MPKQSKLIRITTVPMSLEKLLEHQLQFMQQHYEVTAISADRLGLAKVGEKEGVAIFELNLTRQITPFKDLKALWRLYRYLKKEKPSIVHSHTPKAGTIGMMAARLAGIPHRLHTIAGLPLLEARGFKRKLLNVVEKITCWCATNVYPNSNGLKQIIIGQKLCREDKLKVLGNGSSNGINTAYFDRSNFTIDERKRLRTELNILPEDFVFIFVGRLVKDKGINELVRAFSQLEAKNCKLILVGAQEADLDPLAKDTLVSLAQHKAIITVGFQQDVRPYFAIANALVFPSYREGFPNVVMQAGAMGLPGIVSNINGCNEIIKDKENGLIIPPKDTQAIYSAMKELLENQVLREQLTRNARTMILSRYEQQVVWNAILNEYKRLESGV